jgi:outer membrane protein insertion porin family
LKTEYLNIGKHNVLVDVKLVKQERNRVAVTIVISEGLTSKIKQIKIVGNHAFLERELLNQLDMSTGGMFSFFTHDNEYSVEKMASSLDKLTSYYLDHGYVKFRVESKQVSLSPDHKDIYITIVINEGAQYTIAGFDFSGKFIVDRPKLVEAVSLKKGDIFSRRVILLSSKKIITLLNEKGHANADVNPLPTFDDVNNTVLITFDIKPGEKIYVRRINFTGNIHTNDNVYRRALLQYEGGLYSSTKLEESKRRLMTLPSQNVGDVKISPAAVPGVPNQIDLNYAMTEKSQADINGGIGYSQLNNVMVRAAVTHRNIFGTGNILGVNANWDAANLAGSVEYTNPSYTTSGVSRSIRGYFTHFMANKNNIASYTMNTQGLAMTYSFPFSLYMRYFLGVEFQNQQVTVGNKPPLKFLEFVDNHGEKFEQLKLKAGINYSSLNRWLFPTRGLEQNLGITATAPLGSSFLQYYTATYAAKYYYPIYKDSFVFNLGGAVGYGNSYGQYSNDDGLPFFENFYAGGMGSVRGYKPNTLGPRDIRVDPRTGKDAGTSRPIGGNFKLCATAALIFPNFTESVRTSLFVDGGNVFGNNNIDLNELRYSTGLQIDWMSPIGATFNFAFAKALNKKPGDQTMVFEFGMGMSL